MTSVLAVGIAVVDFVYLVDSLPDRPLKFRARDAAVVGGGMAASAAVAASRLGGRARFAARLGNDEMAAAIVSGLDAEGVDTRMVERCAGGRSPFSSVYVDTAGERQIVSFRGSGLGGDPEWPQDIPRADAVLVDTHWPEGALRALQLARTWGVPGVIDAEAPMSEPLMKAATHIAFSRPGLRCHSDGDDPADALRDFQREVSAWLSVTDGENGVWWTDRDGVSHRPAFRVDVRDTLGAGDIWHGAFALALAEGMAETRAVRFANAAAALKCAEFGGREGCPGRAAVDEFLKGKE